MKHRLRPTLAAAIMLTAVSTGFAFAQGKTSRVGISLPEAQNPFYIQLGNSAVATLKAA